MKSRILLGTTMAAVAVALLLAPACQNSDAAITATVKTKLAADTDVSAFQIDVDTADGIVTLTGNIDDRFAKEEALRIARETDGVRGVEDMISVRRASGTGNAPDADRTLGEGIDDAGITVAVKSKLLADPLVKGLQIDVDTRSGVVYLTGTVNSQAEQDHAIELARSAKNVREVKANLTIERS